MTRNEAEKIVSQYNYNINSDQWFTGEHADKHFVNTLEKLGLIKFDNPSKDSVSLYSVSLYNSPGHYKDHGGIRLEEWPGGLALWIGGRIVYEWIRK